MTVFSSVKARPITCDETSGSLDRSNTARVIGQFAAVIEGPRYVADVHGTYCNVFAWDATKALGCEIPHWWDGIEMTANAMEAWLALHGDAHGWMESTRMTAENDARRGLPVVMTASNQHGHGHIAIGYLGPSGLFTVAQAGRINFIKGTVERAFGGIIPKFWVHE